MAINTLREMFAYADWAQEKVFGLVEGLSDGQLDRSFEMGFGSIRSVMRHIWGAERVWLARWKGEDRPGMKSVEQELSMGELREHARGLAADRDGLFAGQTETSLAAKLQFKDRQGVSHSLPLGGQMLHVVNHGIHHRAQIVNMLRHVGGTVPKPGLDYIFYRLEKSAEPAPGLELGMVRMYQGYADWGTKKLMGIAAGLPDDALDRSFEMGMGTLRKTFSHLWAAEQWWHTNWTAGPAGAFPAADERIGIAELATKLNEAWGARDRFVAGLSDEGLKKGVTVKPRPEMTLEFALGVSLVQLCGHSTHHRGQALNILRHLGAATPSLDLVVWLREAVG